MSANVPAQVHHAADFHRYELTAGGLLAVAEYEFIDGRQVFTHTMVPPELRGQGIAEKLVRAALTDALLAGRKIVPACSYVAKFIARNPEFQMLVAK